MHSTTNIDIDINVTFLDENLPHFHTRAALLHLLPRLLYCLFNSIKKLQLQNYSNIASSDNLKGIKSDTATIKSFTHNSYKAHCFDVLSLKTELLCNWACVTHTLSYWLIKVYNGPYREKEPLTTYIYNKTTCAAGGKERKKIGPLVGPWLKVS